MWPENAAPALHAEARQWSVLDYTMALTCTMPLISTAPFFWMPTFWALALMALPDGATAARGAAAMCSTSPPERCQVAVAAKDKVRPDLRPYSRRRLPSAGRREIGRAHV